jgi:lipopolysaccharide transport system permease protein
MAKFLKEIFDYRELLYVFTARNIKIKYKQSIMGFLWAIFMPIIIVLSGIMVKKAMAVLSGKQLELESIVSVSVKALPWGFFIQSLKFAVSSLVNNMSLVKKIYFPKVVFPLSYILSQLFDFMVATAAFTLMFMIARIGLSVHVLWLPIMILLLVLLTAGLGMILACANLYFRDVKYIVDVILTFGIFFTPVFYESSMFSFGNILLLNPVGAILENINNILVLHRAPNMFWLVYAAAWAAFTFFWGWAFFHKKEPTFAEFI